MGQGGGWQVIDRTQVPSVTLHPAWCLMLCFLTWPVVDLFQLCNCKDWRCSPKGMLANGLGRGSVWNMWATLIRMCNRGPWPVGNARPCTCNPRHMKAQNSELLKGPLFKQAVLWCSIVVFCAFGRLVFGDRPVWTELQTCLQDWVSPTHDEIQHACKLCFYLIRRLLHQVVDLMTCLLSSHC